MAELTGKPGFATRSTDGTASKRRAAALELIATVALTISLVVAATAVSIGNRAVARGEVAGRASIVLPIDHAAMGQ